MVHNHLVYRPFPIDEWTAGKQEVVVRRGVPLLTFHRRPTTHVVVLVVLFESIVRRLQGLAIHLRGVDMVGLIAFVILWEDVPHNVVFEIMLGIFQWVVGRRDGESFVSVGNGQAVV